MCCQSQQWITRGLEIGLYRCTALNLQDSSLPLAKGFAVVLYRAKGLAVVSGQVESLGSQCESVQILFLGPIEPTGVLSVLSLDRGGGLIALQLDQHTSDAWPVTSMDHSIGAVS